MRGVRHVVTGEHDRLRELRLRSLAADPEAFRSSYEAELGLPAERWEQWAAESDAGVTQRTFVAHDRDRWAGLALVRLADGQAVLNAMWVAPEARGRGAARALCDACAEWARRRGCDELVLGVMPGNQAARGAYAACGFEERGRDGEELVMVRGL